MGEMKIIKGMGKLLSRLAGYLAALWRQRQRRNQWMARRYTSAMLALIGTLVCLAVAVYALFVNPCLGVANDKHRQSENEQVRPFLPGGRPGRRSGAVLLQRIFHPVV